MDKVYDHTKYEEKIYKLWEKSGAFVPRVTSHRSPFTIIMPPPNANDPLHIGHARFVAIEDILIRYHRMKGEPTLWLPGGDHAGTETQYVFEKRLAKEGKSRFDFDRDTLYKMIWDYVAKNTGIMEKQLRQLGASCDWTRFKFTLDQDVVKIVYKTFKKLCLDGLIYRGKRIVNYCTRCGTNYSQLEVDTLEREDNLYYLDYGTVTIATTRPETIFADVAVAVNPKDKRYKRFVGKTAVIPLVEKRVPIIEDDLVDIKVGSGALKITPGHDAIDFEIGQRHNLPTLSVIDQGGRLVGTPEKYIRMTVEEARETVVKDLGAVGKINKVEKIKHLIGVCYRDKTVIEPRISEQWFMKVAPLVKLALLAIKKGEVKFIAKRFEKIAKHWYKILYDWNISRQIVWGIRIPAWKCNSCSEWTITDGPAPDKCRKCSNDKLTQDPDTFDTWFSSGQWPFATLLSSANSKFQILNSKFIDKNPKSDFNNFYPTSVMNTAYDIIPFWVIRMIMFGLYTTGKVPFKEVLIHGLVRDKEGQKISKSKGNVIDPIEMAQKYGSDALRMALVWGALVENDIALSENNVLGQRNFANKIWNIARFVLANKSDSKQLTVNSKLSESDKWIMNELKKTVKRCTEALDNYRLNEVAEEIYDFIWHRFADKYIERVKELKSKRVEVRKSAIPILYRVLDQSLRLLHPFMPFVTEAIWQELGEKELLITSPWPVYAGKPKKTS